MIFSVDEGEGCWLMMLPNWLSLASGSMMKGKRGLGKASKVEAERAILSFLKALRHVVDHIKGNLGLVRLVRGVRI